LITLFPLLNVYGGDSYLVNLKVVSKTTKCRDFTVILSICYRDFLTALARAHGCVFDLRADGLQKGWGFGLYLAY